MTQDEIDFIAAFIEYKRNMAAAIKRLEETVITCDHMLPNGDSAWKHGCRDATCSICGLYEPY